jgi:AmiR/NasT family two-component response regulator
MAYSSEQLANGQLREALESRELIGQAKGILMARERCSADAAFDILREVSQRTNRKLREVAQDVVDSV